MKRVFILILALIGVSNARSAVSVNDDDSILAVGAGVSAPSETDAIADNPAGFALNRRTKILGAASAEDKSFNPFSATGRLVSGNGTTGGAVGIHTHKVGHEDRLTLDYGLAAYSDSFKSMIGIGGSTALHKGDRPFNDSNLINLGMLSNPYGSTRVGAGLIGILGGVDYYTFGATTDMGGGTVFSLDSSCNTHFDGRTIEPAFGYRGQSLSFEAGYGFRIDTRADSYIRKGFTAGLSLPFSKDFSVQGVYNHHSKYYVSLTASF